MPPVMVIDTSMTMRYFFVYEKDRDAAEALFQSMKMGNCIGVVPVTWGLEVANVLCGKMREEKVDKEILEKMVIAITELPIMSDSDTHRHALTTTLNLAEKHNLRVHDASFLELAQRLGVALGTYDKALFKAAVSEGVKVFPSQLPK